MSSWQKSPPVFVLALLILILPAIFIAQQREVDLVRRDAGLRAEILARALWLRLEDARQEIPGVLVSSNLGSGVRLKWIPLPWYVGEIELVRRGESETISPQAGELRSPVWVISNLQAGVYQALDKENPRPYPVVGLDAFAHEFEDGGSEVEPVKADGEVFFARQKRLDALRGELIQLLAWRGYERDPLSVVLESDGSSVFSFNSLASLHSDLSQDSRQKTQTYYGSDRDQARVFVELGYMSPPDFSENFLYALPVFLGAIVVFIVLRTKLTRTTFFLLLIISATIVLGVVWNEANQRADNRSSFRQVLVHEFKIRHGASNTKLAQAAPTVWNTFPFAGHEQIDLETEHPVALILFLAAIPGLVLSLHFSFLEQKSGWLAIGLGIGVLAFLSFIYFQSLLETIPMVEVRELGGGSAVYLEAFLGLTLQTLLALALVFAWDRLKPASKGIMFAIVSLPLFASSLYHGLLGHLDLTGLAHFARMSSGLPLILVAMLLARLRITGPIRQAQRLVSDNSWRLFYYLDLRICLKGAIPAWFLSFWILVVKTEQKNFFDLSLSIIFSVALFFLTIKHLPLWRGWTRKEEPGLG